MHMQPHLTLSHSHNFIAHSLTLYLTSTGLGPMCTWETNWNKDKG